LFSNSLQNSTKEEKDTLTTELKKNQEELFKSFHQNLVAIGPVVSEEKIKM
jgi:hypothetical protein